MVAIWVSLAIAVLVAGVAAAYDVRWTKIPDWLSLGTLGASLVGHLVWGLVSDGVHGGLVELSWSMLGAVLCGALPWTCWRAGTFGGGDVKLLAAMGALCLPRLGMTIEFYAMIVASIIGVAKLSTSGKLSSSLSNTIALSVNSVLPEARRRPVPTEALTPIRFAPAILAGAIGCCLFASKHDDGLPRPASVEQSSSDVAALTAPPSPSVATTAMNTPALPAPKASANVPSASGTTAKTAGRTVYTGPRPSHQRPAPSAHP